MSLWEYKVITSGKGGFATPALLEKFLNDLGREDWEIVHFQTQPDNFLAFTGLVRRTTQRDWTLEDAAAAAAKAEAEKLRVEFEAKFKAAASSTSSAGAADAASASFLDEKVSPDDGFRKPVDTSRDDDPEAQDDDKTDDWDKLVASEEEELPTFFEAIRPHMRRNQRGPGMSVGVDYLAKKWDQTEEDLKGALVECGFVMPADEDTKPEYIEYDGDLYWLNINRRGELWINTKEKPRPVFRPVKGARVEMEAPKPDSGGVSAEGETKPVDAGVAAEGAVAPQPEAREPKAEAARVPLPEGEALLDKIRPHMRRNRRGPGGSGSASFLSRALRTSEADLKAAFATLGLVMPAAASDKPVYTEIAGALWWLNLDSRGGLWINGREKKAGEASAPSTTADAAEPVSGGENAAVAAEAVASEAVPAQPAPSEEAGKAASPSLFATVRPLLKETKTGAVAGKVERLAEELGRPAEELVNALVGAGLKIPEKARERPVFVEHAGEILWFNKNAKGELWLNAKVSKFSDKEEGSGEDETGESPDEKKPARRSRSRGRKSGE